MQEGRRSEAVGGQPQMCSSPLLTVRTLRSCLQSQSLFLPAVASSVFSSPMSSYEKWNWGRNLGGRQVAEENGHISSLAFTALCSSSLNCSPCGFPGLGPAWFPHAVSSWRNSITVGCQDVGGVKAVGFGARQLRFEFPFGPLLSGSPWVKYQYCPSLVISFLSVNIK